MRIASRRYPTGRSGGDHPTPPLRGMSASVGGTGRLRGFRGGTPAPRMCWGTRTPPLQEAAPHARPGCGVPGPRVSGLGGRLVLLRGCREPAPYTAPAAPAPCGDGQKFHSGRACPREGGQCAVGASGGRIYAIRGAAVRWVYRGAVRCVKVQLLSYLWCQGGKEVIKR